MDRIESVVRKEIKEEDVVLMSTFFFNKSGVTFDFFRKKGGEIEVHIYGVKESLTYKYKKNFQENSFDMTTVDMSDVKKLVYNLK